MSEELNKLMSSNQVFCVYQVVAIFSRHLGWCNNLEGLKLEERQKGPLKQVSVKRIERSN